MINQPVSAIFFDLFATLISVSKAAGEQGRYTADILGIDRARWSTACFSEHHEICRPTNQAETIMKMAHSLDPTIPIALIEEAAEERQRRFDHALIDIEPNILEALMEMKSGGFRLGLISNASTDEVRAWPESPLRSLFETALFSCDCGLKKPQPGIYQLALSRMGVSADQSLFVGDGNSQEHLGAAQAGIRSLLVTHFIGHCSEADLERRREGATGTIAHIRELTSVAATA